MAEVVFVLGAGASKAGGAPLMREFFNTAQSLHRAGSLNNVGDEYRAVLAGLEQLQRASAKSSIDLLNVESVWGAFEMAEIVGRLGTLPRASIPALTTALRRLIVAVIEASLRFPCRAEHQGIACLPPRGYDWFANLLTTMLAGKRDVAVLTFNYDVGLDYALFHNQIAFDYCHDEQQGARLAVCKLHGSLNWRKRESGIEILPFRTARQARLLPIDKPPAEMPLPVLGRAPPRGRVARPAPQWAIDRSADR